jgi:serine phosphatase RsbU (regulator of sigma subunit)
MPAQQQQLSTPTVPDPSLATRTLLRISNRSSQASYVPLVGHRFVLGRSGDVNVPLESTKVSRQHAELFKDPFDRWWVRDLGSRNGTRVNGARVSESIVHPGDVLEVGDFVLSLCPAVPTLDQSSVSLTPQPPSTTESSSAPVAGRPHRVSVQEDSGNDQVRSLNEFEAPKIAGAHLSAVTEFGHRLNTTHNAGERLKALCELMVSDEFHGRSVVVLRAPRAAPEKSEVIWGPMGAAGASSVVPPLSRRVLRVVCDRAEPVLATNVSRAPVSVELSISADVMALTVIAAPLRYDAQTIELVYVVFDPEYSHSDWLALAALAVKHFQQAEAVWLNVEKIRQYAAVERELEKAQEIQQRLIPTTPAMPGLALAIGFRPCYWVGGDYADVLKLADGRILLAIADVCGKGLSAALVASSCHTMVHANVRAGKDLAVVTAELNQYLVEDLGGNSFVTLLAVAIDPRTGEFEWVNGGHPPALIVAASGDLRELKSPGNPPLGVDPQPPRLLKDRLGPGELLVIYTDGVTELLDPAGEMLGLEGLSKGLRQTYGSNPSAPVPELAERLTSLLDQYQRGAVAADDRTFLLARLE